MFASCIICFISVIRYINIYCVSTCTNFTSQKNPTEDYFVTSFFNARHEISLVAVYTHISSLMGDIT